MSEQAQTMVLVVALFLTVMPALWLLVTTLLSVLSGWFRLQGRFPDRDDIEIATLESRSGQMGRFMLMGIGYGYSLHFDLCMTGLRVRVTWLLGPFCRPFFVPWPELRVDRKRAWVRFHFGDPAAGTLAVSSGTAEELAELSGGLLKVPNPAP